VDGRALLRETREHGRSGVRSRKRKSWCSVGLPRRAPVLANHYGSASAGLHPELPAAGHISIPHGRVHEALLEGVLDALAGFLTGHIAVTFGLTYVGV
jgi:hypothetical protein